MGARVHDMFAHHDRIMDTEPGSLDRLRAVAAFVEKFGGVPIVDPKDWPNMEFAGMDPRRIKETRRQRKIWRRHGGRGNFDPYAGRISPWRKR